jgi:hypothetical protein
MAEEAWVSDVAEVKGAWIEDNGRVERLRRQSWLPAIDVMRTVSRC